MNNEETESAVHWDVYWAVHWSVYRAVTRAAPANRHFAPRG